MSSLGLRREIKNIKDSIDVVSKDVTTKFADVFDELLILSTKIKIKDQELDQVERELGLMKQDTEEMKKQTEEMKKQTQEMKKEREEMEKKTKEKEKQSELDGIEHKRYMRELKQETEEMKKQTEEMKQQTKEMKKETEEMKQQTKEMKKETEEMKKKTQEIKKEREELEKKTKEKEKQSELDGIKHERYMRELKQKAEDIEREIKIEAEKREKQHYEDLKKEFRSLRGHHDFVRGGIIEKIYIANIISLYAAKKWKIHTILSNHHVIDGNNRTLTEIDVLSINDEFVLVTEVKLQLTNDRVDRFVAKLPIIKTYLVRRGIHQPVYGAVAAIQDYFIVEDQSDKYLKRFQPPPKYNQQLLNSKSISALKYAETKHGLFTIELFGHTAKFSGETGATSFKPKVYEAAHEPSITF